MSLLDKIKRHGTESGRPPWNDKVRYGNKRKQQARLKVQARRRQRAIENVKIIKIKQQGESDD